MHRKMPYDQTLILIVLALTAFGLIMVYSASATVSHKLYGNTVGIFMRQLVATLIGLAALVAAMKVDYHHYARPLLVYPLLGFCSFLLIVPHFTSSGEAAARWIRLGPFQFQPSELAKVAIILFTAYYLSRETTSLAWLRTGLLPPLAVIGSIIVLVLLGRDLGTAGCIALVAGFQLYLGGLRYRHIPIVGTLAASAVALLIWMEPYRWQRILDFLSSDPDPVGSGYQIRQSLIAVGSGGLAGKGLADGAHMLNYLPESHTDFIFAVIAEEFGLLGCLAVLGLFLLLLWRGTRIALRADTPFGTYLAAGLVGIVVLQALVNMSVVVKLLPTKGIPLPFISVGGSSMMVLLGAMGVLLNISSHTRSTASGRRV